MFHQVNGRNVYKSTKNPVSVAKMSPDVPETMCKNTSISEQNREFIHFGIPNLLFGDAG
jgi:hypothetical protein